MVLAGYQPSLGVTDAATAVVRTMADADCPEVQDMDCCDRTEKSKRLCVWSDCCAARCHINAGLEVAAYAAPVLDGAVAAPGFREPIVVVAVRASPLFRPPIV